MIRKVGRRIWLRIVSYDAAGLIPPIAAAQTPSDDELFDRVNRALVNDRRLKTDRLQIQVSDGDQSWSHRSRDR